MSSLAELLRELKERSGLSYGVLATRLHMSTSTLHRYCNGGPPPAEFTPVKQFARLCGATPEELVEVHRRWVLADADRGRKAEPAAPAPTSAPTPAPAPETVSSPPSPLSPSRRWRALVLAATVAAVVGIGSVTLAMNGGGDGDTNKQTQKENAGPTAPPDPSASPYDRPGKSADRDQLEGQDRPGAKGRPDGKGTKSDPSASLSKDGRNGKSEKGSPAPDGSRGGGKGPVPVGGPSKNLRVPLTARISPYLYEDCEHSFLVNREPDKMPEPPSEGDVPAWVGELGAVSARNQYIAFTVQGTGEETVTLRDMNVRVQSSGAPLAWNNFQMGTHCGDKLFNKIFTVDLDDATPRAVPEPDQRDFPYKVSEKDPQVFYIEANSDLHDVRWYLELEWSSGERHDVLRIDDQGKPFRTSGREGRPLYSWSESGGWAPGGLDHH
ncbi:helix-turn-helix domain-containing protein [Streptomyces sp. NPDC056486]|uniref:helix-turn-helix domain-containing protein n=1 Tax=Streptomyces sp. NPDC056486 TaxID=3345835 RepID=UPI0036CE41DD